MFDSFLIIFCLFYTEEKQSKENDQKYYDQWQKQMQDNERILEEFEAYKQQKKNEFMAENQRVRNELMAENQKVKNELMAQNQKVKNELMAENAKVKNEMNAKNKELQSLKTENYKQNTQLVSLNIENESLASLLTDCLPYDVLDPKQYFNDFDLYDGTFRELINEMTEIHKYPGNWWNKYANQYKNSQNGTNKNKMNDMNKNQMNGMNQNKNNDKNKNSDPKHEKEKKINPLDVPFNKKYQKEVQSPDKDIIINWIGQFNWQQPKCTVKSHYEHNEHKNKIDVEQGCVLGSEYDNGAASGLCITTNPYFVIIGAAHSFPDIEGIKNYTFNWCPVDDFTFQIPIKFVKKHPQYKYGKADFDICIAVGLRSTTSSESLSSLSNLKECRMEPFSITFGPSIASDYRYLKGYSHFIEKVPKLYQSELKVLNADNETIHLSGGGLRGQSGGPIFEHNKCNSGRYNVIGIQARVGKANPTYPEDFTEVLISKISDEKMVFLKQYVPGKMMYYKSKMNQSYYLTFYDKK